MTAAKKRQQKDTAKELIKGYFEGLIKQNKKYKEKTRIYSKNNNTLQSLSKKDK
jgi:hypothetical protein